MNPVDSERRLVSRRGLANGLQHDAHPIRRALAGVVAAHGMGPTVVPVVKDLPGLRSHQRA